MADPRPDLHKPWFVAVWPGMGGVAQIAGQYLVQELGAVELARIEPGAWFDLNKVQIDGGLLRPAELPETVFYGWKDPAGGRDLVLLVSEAQPDARTREYCEEVLDVAQDIGVELAFTFAAIATPIHPRAEPRVFATATELELLERVDRAENVERLDEGEISGMNGVFLAAAAARGLGGACLLGEFPYFASAVPNPKSSLAVLRVFLELAGIELSLDGLQEQSDAVEERLVESLEQLQERAGAEISLVVEEDDDDEEGAALKEPERPLAPEIAARIEELFDDARLDRTKALRLKATLDEHGVFRRYEDRFLDLFRQAE